MTRKLNFLKQNFRNHRAIKVLDIGAGSGYFVSSLLDKNFKNVQGLEVSKSNQFLEKVFLKQLKKIIKNYNKPLLMKLLIK